jgi:hypothetical protein
MKKLLSQVTKVIKSFNKDGFTFKSEDNCEDSLEYFDVEGHEVIVGDDNNRESWNVSLNDIKGTGSLEDVLVKVLGTPSQIHDGDRRVFNWEPSKNVLIVWFEDSIEFTQYYSKR